MEKITEFSYKEKEIQSKSNSNVLVSSGIFIIDVSRVSRFKAVPEQSLSPDLLNFVNYEKMQIYLWQDWRFSIDSLAILQEARLKLSAMSSY